MTSTDWRADALCARRIYRTVDFFPAPRDQLAVAEAKAVCAACPIRTACLADALRNEGGRRSTSRDGIRGGLTPGQRFGIYKRAARARRADRERRSKAPS